MSIYDVISLLGAIATFLFGMATMTSGLEKLSSGRLESILERLTNNLFMSVLIGALVTGLVHSSAATTIMCVGFVNSGIMKLEQTVGIIMGANIGTTVTAQILRLGDVSSDNLLLSMMRPEYFGPIMAVAGIVLYMFVKGGKKRIVGQLLLGLGLLFISMHTMTAAVAPLQDVPEFRNLFVAFSNPLLGILVGALVTALLQSSTASVGILQALTSTGVITFNIAFPIIMGQNIGTCITTLISSIGASRNARRTAMLHLYFNVIGTLVFLAAIYGAQLAAAPAGGLPFWSSVMNMGDIASFHTFFNIGCTVLLLPFHKQLVRLVERTVPGDESRAFTMLDERFLATPAVALERAHDAVVHMGYPGPGQLPHLRGAAEPVRPQKGGADAGERGHPGQAGGRPGQLPGPPVQPLPVGGGERPGVRAAPHPLRLRADGRLLRQHLGERRRTPRPRHHLHGRPPGGSSPPSPTRWARPWTRPWSATPTAPGRWPSRWNPWKRWWTSCGTS